MFHFLIFNFTEYFNMNFRCVFLLCLITFQANTQELIFNHLTTVDGLPNNEVRKITKDAKGFLWFGTSNGLSRYDGYRLKTLKMIPNDKHSLVGNRIFSLAVSINKVWVGTLNGLSVVDPLSMEVLPSEQLTKTTGNGIITNLFVDQQDRVWLANEKHNYIINARNFETKEILKGYQVVCISKTLRNTFWIGTDKGLLHYDLENNKILKTYEIGGFNLWGLDKIYVDSYGMTWLTFQNGIYKYQSDRDRFVKLINLGNGNAIAENLDGSLLFGSYQNGVLHYDRVTGVFEPIISDPSIEHSISSDDVYDIFINNDGSVWIGTQEGVDYVDFSRNRFKSLIHFPHKTNSLRNNFVQAIYVDDLKNYWIGMRNGVDKVIFDGNFNNPRIEHFKGKGENFKLLNNSYVTSIFKDSKSRLWFGTSGTGLFMYTEKTKKLLRFTTIENDENSIASNSVRHIFEDSKGRIWFATNNGMSRLKQKNKETIGFENIRDLKHKDSVLPLKDVYIILQDSNERIWVGMNNGGLVLITEEEKGDFKFISFKNTINDERSLSNDEVFVLFEDSNQRIWVGTSGLGLNLLMEDGDLQKNKGYYFKRFTQENGLANNEINAILEDDQKNLWVATNNGLSKLNLANYKIKNYTTYDGVLKGKFRKNSAFKSKDRILLFGGAAGINYFQLNEFSNNNNIVPHPVFTNFLIDGQNIKVNQKIDNQVVLSENLKSGTKINLPINKNGFELEFSALSFSSPLRNSYKYKLDGFEKDWNYLTGDNPRVHYSNLPPGEYRFYLKASNNEDLWNEEPIYLDIVLPFSFFSLITIKITVIVLFLLVLTFGLLIITRRKRKLPNALGEQNIARKNKILSEHEQTPENLEKVNCLNNLMVDDQLFLDQQLNLKQLSGKLEISTNQLSMLLNDYIGKNFYDYVNEYRIEEVKKRLSNPTYGNQTLSSIGLDCGFNSKSAFNRIFKNTTGKTPSEYKKFVASKSAKN